MSTGNVVLGTVLGIVAGAGVLLLVQKAQAAPALAPGTTPGTTVAKGGQVAWVDATQLNPGDKVRVSVKAADFATLAQSMGGTTLDMAGWQNLLANPTIQHVLMAPTMSAWAPGDVLPPDWPADDVGAATEYHAEFVYGGFAPLLIAAQPIPMRAWVAKGVS